MDPERRTAGRAYAGLLVCTVLWASAFILAKVVLREMTPVVVAAWRYLLAGLILLPLAFRQRPTRNPRKVLPTLVLMIVFGGVLYPWLFIEALARTSSVNTSLLIALNPIFTLVFSPLVGEAFILHRLPGVALALAGAVAVITHGDLNHLAAFSLNTGDLLALAAAGSWSVFNLSSRSVLIHLAPSVVNAIAFLAGGIVLWGLGVGDRPVAQLAAASTITLAGLVFLAVFSSVIGGQLFLHGVRTVGVNRTVVFIYLIPVVTAGLATMLLGEHFGPAQGWGGAAVLAGVYLTTRS